MVLKGVNWVHNDKIRSNGLERSEFGYTIIKLGQMVLKGVNWVHNTKIRSYGLELGHMAVKGVNWVHNDKIRSNDLERSQLGIQYKNSWISVNILLLSSRRLSGKCGFWPEIWSKSMDFVVFQGKIDVSPWFLSLDWKLINNVVLLN